MSKSPAEIATVLLDFDSFDGNIRTEFQELVNDFFTKPADDEDFDSDDWDDDENEIDEVSLQIINDHDDTTSTTSTTSDLVDSDGDDNNNDDHEPPVVNNYEDAEEPMVIETVVPEAEHAEPAEVEAFHEVFPETEEAFLEKERDNIENFKCECKLHQGAPCYQGISTDQFMTNRLDMMAIDQGLCTLLFFIF